MALKQNKSIRINWVNRPNAKLYRKFLSIFCMMRGPSRCSLPRFKIIHGRVGTHPMVIGVSSRMPWRTNFHKLCSSSGDKTPLLKPGFFLPLKFSKNLKKPFFVLLIGSLWETAILNWNPHGRCSDNFAIKPWIPPFGYIPSDFKSKPSIHPQNSFSLFPIYSIKPKNYSLSFRIRPGTCFKHG